VWYLLSVVSAVLNGRHKGCPAKKAYHKLLSSGVFAYKISKTGPSVASLHTGSVKYSAAMATLGYFYASLRRDYLLCWEKTT
jgi:hypothetical protein